MVRGNKQGKRPLNQRSSRCMDSAMHSREVVCEDKRYFKSHRHDLRPDSTPILSFHDFRHSTCFDIHCWREAKVPFPVRVSTLNDPLLLYTAPSRFRSPAGGTQVAKNKLLFSALQAGRVFVIVHFREAFFVVFFLFSELTLLSVGILMDININIISRVVQWN